jgi:ketosteroid isomerase-like protein
MGVRGGGPMRSAILILVGFLGLCFTPILAQAQGPDANLRSELVALHSKWMKAFYTGDNATMDELETENLVLIMPVGEIWSKNGPRVAKQQVLDPQTEATLSDVSVRRFGDTVILTGTLHSKSAKESFLSSTTVVFVKNVANWKIASAQWTPVEGQK